MNVSFRLCYLMQVIDEYDEQSEVAERLRIKVIYGFSMHFFVHYEESGQEKHVLCKAKLRRTKEGTIL